MTLATITQSDLLTVLIILAILAVAIYIIRR